MTEKIRVLKIIHLAICGGTIFLYLILGGISRDILKIPNMDSTSMIYLVIPILAFFLSNFLFKSQLKQADRSLNLEDNFGIYQSASIIRWAILEAAALMIVILAPDLMIFGILIILYLLFIRPTENRLKADLQYMA